MDKIEELITYHKENEYLDFKEREYRKEGFASLIKDVASFANANYAGDRFIIIGIRKKDDDITAVAVENSMDSSRIQELVHSNITPEVNINYESYLFEGKTIMVLTINDPQNQPYAIVKDYRDAEQTQLRKNEIYMRKGSRSLLMALSDFERIYKKKYSTTGLDGKIELKFENGNTEIELPCITNIELPSDREKRLMEEEHEFQHAFMMKNGGNLYLQVYADEAKGGTSYQEMDMPQLRHLMSNVKMNYASDDKYYLEETRAFKLNFAIINNAEFYLKKALFLMRIPLLPGLKIVPRIALTTRQMSMPDSIPKYNYPEITTESNIVIIRQELGEIRHQLGSKVFGTALRISADEKLIGQSQIIQAQIFGANLSAPQNFEFKITYV
ncbi:helix-turn-helix domain-containing protein [Mucilaginibacter sp. OK098]|uniref:AlbA family DNA-binding domain-containing protein n=1 Tax=Mucilaginibacter sp. OK098 TaxID=1855297 RepID=UPI000915E4E7|nr:ATP-binding protein [Mucilaginibacter sp. OK098]SHN26062.1 Putative DNA-binding domain-containing protein [Mucilaginibacter sp. OK098]